MKNIFNILLNCIVILISVLIQKIIYRFFNLSYNLVVYWGSILAIFFVISICIEFIKSTNNNLES
jgi:hypothetical protein